jgi:hypothetical protein
MCSADDNPSCLRRYLVWLLVAAGALEGCVSNPGYPERWSGLLPAAKDCPSITGIFYNQGEEDNPESSARPIYLSSLVFLDMKDSKSIEKIEISEPEVGVIEIKTRNKNQLEYMRRLSAKNNDYHCEGGAVKISSSEVVSEQVAGLQFDSFYFYKSLDQSLIVKHTSSGLGLVLLVIPVGGSLSTWFRFEPFSTD